MTRAISLLVLISMLCGVSALADGNNNSSVPLELQEQRNAIDEFESDAKTAIAMANSLTAKKKAQCMNAFGDINFCTCIAQKTPVAINFVQYITAVVSTNDELQFDMLPPNDQKLITFAREARNDCTIKPK